MEKVDFRLFNCDRTFNLDKVQALIAKVSPKAIVKQQYFPLPRMSELCNELKDEGSFSGYCVFVVHAHESRLSLNEQNAGIGYAKLYRTLLKISDGHVLIVIGGDDNYKDHEQEDAFLSQWVWRKICSQFTEDFMDGTKSFIFSWDENHQPIHEEALQFYLNVNRKPQKFVSKPSIGARASGGKPKATVYYQQETGTQNQTPLPDGAKDHTLTLSEHFKPENNKGRQLPQPDGETEPTSSEGVMDAKDPSKSIGSKSSNQQGTATQSQTPLPPDAKDHKLTSSGRFKPESNIGRPLPQLDGDTELTSLEGVMDAKEPSKSKIVSKDTIPMSPIVQVVSILSPRDDILRNSVLNVISDAFHALNIRWGPYVPDIKPQNLPRHIKETSPDLVVLLSDYDDFIDVQNLNPQIKLFRDLLTSVENEESTKLIFVVTGDIYSKKDDLHSPSIEIQVKRLFGHKLTILSWDSNPNRIHLDVITGLLRDYKAIDRKTSNISVPRENDVEKGRLKLRAIIEDGRLLAILKSDPYCWTTEEILHLLSEAIRKYHKRTRFEVWENDDGSIIAIAISEADVLRKVVDIGPTKRRHSLQVYSYHSNKKTFRIVKDFFKGLDLWHSGDLRDVSIDLDGLFHNIERQRPEFVAFSSDITTFWNIQYVKQLVDRYHGLQSSIANLKGIIIILIGDENCRDGDLVSDDVCRSVNELTEIIPELKESITVISWRDKPFVAHQDKMKSLLFKGQSKHSAAGRSVTGTPTAEGPTLPKNTEFDPTKGYLRYRADLEFGHVVKVVACYPPDWSPDNRDLVFIAEKYRKVPKAVLEFWGHSFDGLAGAPVVKTEEKRWLPKFLCRKNSTSGDYV